MHQEHSRILILLSFEVQSVLHETYSAQLICRGHSLPANSRCSLDFVGQVYRVCRLRQGPPHGGSGEARLIRYMDTAKDVRVPRGACMMTLGHCSTLHLGCSISCQWVSANVRVQALVGPRTLRVLRSHKEALSILSLKAFFAQPKP